MSFDNRRSTMEGGATGGASTGDVQSQASVSLCKSGCGFYANAAFEGMCSKCFKDEQLRQQKLQQNSEQLPSAVVNNPLSDSTAPSHDISDALSSPLSSNTSIAAESAKVSAAVTCATEILGNSAIETGAPTVLSANSSRASMSDMSVDGEGDDSSQDSGSEKKKKNRCHTCKKRVGLTGFECRCGGLYCSIHRYSDKHNCNFDYKELGQDQIRKNNPVVVGEKIQKL